MRKIKLTQNKFALVDDEDFERLNEFNWHYSDYGVTGYAKRVDKQTRKGVRMHHMVIPLKKGFMTDHINMNGLDNRKQNLRLVTKSQNMMNGRLRVNSTSGYKGVCWDKRNEKWIVHIWKNYKQIYLGYFDDKIEAAKAYNEAAKKYYGEYARLNIC